MYQGTVSGTQDKLQGVLWKGCYLRASSKSVHPASAWDLIYHKKSFRVMGINQTGFQRLFCTSTFNFLGLTTWIGAAGLSVNSIS